VISAEHMACLRPRSTTGARGFAAWVVDEVREYRELKRENARLKKLLADRELEVDAMKEVMRKKL